MKMMVHGRGLYAWVTAVQLAAAGHAVVLRCCDEPDDEVRQEPGLEARAQRLMDAGALHVVADWPQPLPDIHWLALSTQAHQSVPQRAMDLLARTAGPLTLVVLNTVPVGTLADLQAQMSARAPTRHITVLALPLFIRSGQALSDFATPALLLMGEPTPGAAAPLVDWLRPYSRQAKDRLTVPLGAAELTKFAVNAMLASRLSVMNELANLAGRLGVDIEWVRQGLAADPRIGPDYLQPGCGFGGPSFTDDLFQFAEALREAGGQPGVLDAVLRVNAEQREKPFRQLWRHFEGQLEGRRIALWGAAYKPGAASVEHATVHAVVQALLAQQATVVVHDPKALPALAAEYPAAVAGGQLILADEPLAAAVAADALLLLTAWPCYHNPDYAALWHALKTPVIIDGRNVFEPAVMTAQGFIYYGMGRGQA